MKKSKPNRKVDSAAIDRALDEALAAKPQDVKVAISLRLDSDLYMELKKRAKQGAGGGKYQTLINEILRESLFSKDGTHFDGEQLKRQMMTDLQKMIETVVKSHKEKSKKAKAG